MGRDFSKATYKTNPRFATSIVHGAPLTPVSVEDRAAGKERIAEMEGLMDVQRERIANLRPLAAANDNHLSTRKAAA